MFPPFFRVSARRPYYMARTFVDQGQRVTVLTSSNPDNNLSSWKVDLTEINIIRAPRTQTFSGHSLIRRISSWFYQKTTRWPIIHRIIRNIVFFVLPMEHQHMLEHEFIAKIKELDIDVIITTGGPWCMFELGKMVHMATGKPLFLDYRDACSVYNDELIFGELHDLGSGIIGKIKRWYNRKRERNYGKLASGISAVSEPMLANCLQASGANNGAVIQNGYGEDYETGFLPDNEKLVLTFTGTINRNQNLRLLMSGLEMFFQTVEQTSPEIEINFIGLLDSNEQDIVAFLNSDVKDRINATGYISLNECLALQAKSDVLISIGLKKTKGVPGSKIYEYLQAKRPILLASEQDDGRESIVNNTNTGWICRTPKQISDLITKLHLLKASGEKVPYNPNTLAVQELSYSAQMKKYLSFLVKSISHRQ